MQSDRDVSPDTVNDATHAVTGSPSVTTGGPTATTGKGQLATTMGFILLTGFAVLILLVALRFVRRAADPEIHGFGRRKPTRGFERGRGRDPWSEAGRRMVIPPTTFIGDGTSSLGTGDRRDGPSGDGGNEFGDVGDAGDGGDGDGGGSDGGGGDGGGGDGGGSD